MNRHDVAPGDHFRDATKMVTIGAERPVSSTMLTRYACYLVAQNGERRSARWSAMTGALASEMDGVGYAA